MKGIVGTGGHIDHGKTALIGALTGEHTDRLPEEQERGISIDLGFTHLETRHGTLGVIDVPGHEDFIRNMLAGATGIDVLLLVVAADEGVMPQTREHAAIAELLGVHRAVVALTKVDLVDEEWLGLAHDDVADFLADTPFAGAPVVPTSATEGTGVEEVRAAIENVFVGTRGRPDDLFRLPVDRTFTVKGTGTVVTGTVWSGTLETDAAVHLLPGGVEARVRGLQVHGGDVDRVEPGERAALALAGVDREAIRRGMTVVAGEGWAASSNLTGVVRLVPHTRWRLEPWQRVRVHLGTEEVMARVVLLDGDGLDPGGEGWVHLRLEEPMVARAGDRFVIRSYSPVTTIGGGVVAEPLADKRSGLGPEERDRLRTVVEGNANAAVRALLLGGAAAGEERALLPILTGATPGAVDEALSELGAVDVGSRVFDPAVAEAVRTSLIEAVDRFHAAEPLRPGMDPEALRRDVGVKTRALVSHVLDALMDEGVLVVRRGAVARPDFTPELTEAQATLRDRIRAWIADHGVAAPRLDEVREEFPDPELDDLVALLAAEGALVRIEHDLYLDADALDAAVGRIRQELGGRQGLSPGDFREVVDVSRKHLIPLLEHLDRRGTTVREGDGRSVPE